MQSINILISDLRCASCAARIENAFKDNKGITSIHINTVTKTAQICFEPNITDSDSIIKTIQNSGYSTELIQKSAAPNFIKESQQLKNQLMIASLASIPTAILSMGHDIGITFPDKIATLSPFIQFILTTLVLWIGKDFFTKGAKAVFKSKTATMDTLVALGVGAAYLYSVIALLLQKHMFYFETGAVLITFILLGRYLEALAKGKTSKAIAGLITLQPQKAFLILNNNETEIPISEVKLGDILRVKPGQKIPVDGVIVEGASTVDQSMITGESIPVEKKISDLVIAGTLNSTGSFLMKAEKIGENTILASIIKLVENAQNTKAPIQELTDKISAYFVPFVISLALAASMLWLLLGKPLGFVLNIAVSVLIIACPCALGLATPTAIMVASGLAAKKGILIKNAKAIEHLHSINTIIFDKTGTLTNGRPILTHCYSNTYPNKKLLQIAASIEAYSEHPIAKAIVTKAKEDNIPIEQVNDFEAAIGRHVTGTINNIRYSIGKPTNTTYDYLNDKNKLESEGHTVLIIEENNKAIGYIAVMDTLKPEAKETISLLKKKEIEIVLLSGDNPKTVKKIADECGITTFYAEFTPQKKLEHVQQIQKQGKLVAMVGDGINDAPALTQANIGIAIGQGTDIAIESADIILVNKNLNTLITAIELSEVTIKKIKQNLFWAFFYNAIGLQIAAGLLYPLTGILLNPMIGGFAMAMSSVSVLTNTLFLKAPNTKI